MMVSSGYVTDLWPLDGK